MSRRRQRQARSSANVPPIMFQRLQNRWSPYEIL
ncbi:MAG: hypothetical protein KDE28_11800, partial [Anaerolineales bacterium]|nr:hypothetical protein [Anaerolineales bacterium]